MKKATTSAITIPEYFFEMVGRDFKWTSFFKAQSLKTHFEYHFPEGKKSLLLFFFKAILQ